LSVLKEEAHVTIVVPNWNTGPLLRICLSSLRRFTQVPHQVIVVENGSSDESLQTAERAAEAGQIELITRRDAKNEGAADHAAALDAGLAAARGPLLMTLDSDAWARKPGWLQSYIDALGGGSHAGATKFPSGRLSTLWRQVRGKRRGPEWHYIRPCHALYRVSLLRELGLSFAPHQMPSGRWRTTGEHLHNRLVDEGHSPAFIPHARVSELVGHLYHATIVLNPTSFPGLRERARRRGERRIDRWLKSTEAKAILEGSEFS
jgi:glycosyltransferase involved in cell wall biosynthesis